MAAECTPWVYGGGERTSLAGVHSAAGPVAVRASKGELYSLATP
jgi:hypothetical protein